MTAHYISNGRNRLLLAVSRRQSFSQKEEFIVTALPSSGGTYGGMKSTYGAAIAAGVTFLVERGELDGLFDAFFGWLR